MPGGFALISGGDPVLPVSWCRYGQSVVDLPPLSGWRFVTAWQLDAVALVGLLVAACGYGWAVHRVRVAHPIRPWPWRRSASFAAGLLVIFLATHSSIAVYDMSLFSVHMVQHLMLIMVAPPLLAAGRPLTLLLHAVHNPWHSRIKRAIRSTPVAIATSAPVALAVYAVTIVATHLSGLMSQIMEHPWLGQAEHLLYVAAGYLFFVLVFGDEPLRWRLPMPGRLLLVVVSMAVDTFVGLVLLQTNQPINYIAHPGWGPSPLSDTQTGGAIMWFFGDAIMVVLIVLIFCAWTRRPEYARRQSHGWLERARLATFEQHVEHLGPVAARPYATNRKPQASAAVGTRRPALDDDEERWQAYNDWLASLAQQDSRMQAQDHP